MTRPTVLGGGDGDNLAENVGKVHDYLGMTFDYAFEGEVRINMCKYQISIKYNS